MIEQNEIDRISKKLTLLSGIRLIGNSGISDGYQYIDLHTADPPVPNGFAVRILFSWKSIEISFIPDNFARTLIESMGQSAERNKTFSAIAEYLVSDSGNIRYEINKKSVDPFNPEKWDSKWAQMDLKVIIFTDGFDPADVNVSEDFIIQWSVRFLDMIIALLPIEEEGLEFNEVEGYPEGAISCVPVNKYERNHLNRAACIAIHGCYCHICGIKFEDNYGEIGSGYIHVHHLTPVSKLGGNYIVNPVCDLVPVCPNCHAMLHRRNPPFSPDELKFFLK